VPKLKEERRVLATLTAEQVKKIAGFVPRGKYERRIHTLSGLLLDTGMRIDEALSLRREDVDLDNLLVTVHGKGRKDRVVPISSEGRRVMWNWVRSQRTALVFESRNGTKLRQRNILREFKELGKRLRITGVRFSFHTLRHTFAVGYLRAGGNLFYLSRILGHTSVNTTEKYLQSLGVDDLQAVHGKLSLLSVAGRDHGRG
jgi:integrase/recombinase XerD